MSPWTRLPRSLRRKRTVTCPVRESRTRSTEGRVVQPRLDVDPVRRVPRTCVPKPRPSGPRRTTEDWNGENSGFSGGDIVKSSTSQRPWLSVELLSLRTGVVFQQRVNWWCHSRYPQITWDYPGSSRRTNDGDQDPPERKGNSM